MNKKSNRDLCYFTRREFLTLVGAGATTMTIMGLPGCKSAARNRLPNIVLIFMDDMGYADIGTCGAKGYATPNLDRMAAEGIRFTDFYAASSVCSPSRASILTGCYAPRVGIPDVLAPPGPAWTKGRTHIGLNTSETTIAKMLKPLGYATACVGKWHLGHLPEFLPTRHGFDEYFGLPYSNDMIPEDYPDLPLMDGEQVIELNPDQSQLTTRYTERSLEFIESHRDVPFFLYLPHSMPHVPLAVSEKFKGKTGGLYGDVVSEIDWSVGEILKKLGDLNLDANTLVIFTSDNGPWLEYGNHSGSAAPLREGKFTTFEGGQRVPCLMRWPGKIPAGSTCGDLAATIDLLPTIAAITGAALPSAIIDGKNIRTLMKDPAGTESPRETLFYYAGMELQAVRSGKWKLHLHHAYLHPFEIGHDGSGGKMGDMEQPLSLYDMDLDEEEQHNVAEQHPEIVEQLVKLAKEFDADLKQNSRPPGRVGE